MVTKKLNRGEELMRQIEDARTQSASGGSKPYAACISPPGFELYAAKRRGVTADALALYSGADAEFIKPLYDMLDNEEVIEAMLEVTFIEAGDTRDDPEVCRVVDRPITSWGRAFEPFYIAYHADSKALRTVQGAAHTMNENWKNEAAAVGKVRTVWTDGYPQFVPV
ncbi:MAG: hypothetical protein LBS90_06565 [Oscillospiraceae bacterium]|jgi:hypothetical protein|nr:hypothetical protein [Oscillospiraceae bacterium]